MKVILKIDEFSTKGFISWLGKLPKDRQYEDARIEDMFKYGAPDHRVERIIYGLGFIIENESDPLFIEFKSKFPNTTYRIEE